MTPIMRQILLHRPAGEAVPPLVYDSFNRADNAASLGNADTGQAWEVVGGGWGISSNRAVVTTNSGARNMAVVDSGTPDGVVEVTCGAYALYSGLCFRVVDINNYLRLTPYTASSYALRKTVNNAQTDMATYNIPPASGDVLKVVMDGPTITPYINGVALESVEITDLTTATKHGLMTYNTTTPWYDEFSVQGE